jgi:hypothetical protein
MSSTRITVKDLDRAVIHLNTMLGFTMGAEGSFCLQGAYGGWQLQRHRGSGIESVTYGYRPKREIYEKILNIQYGVQVSIGRSFQTN